MTYLSSIRFKERVDFGKVIGNYVDSSGVKTPTTKGMIVYGKNGVHIPGDKREIRGHGGR
jgi:hypothetical protein